MTSRLDSAACDHIRRCHTEGETDPLPVSFLMIPVLFLLFQLENGCLLSAANAAYIRTRLMPNGNGVTTGSIPVSCPDGLSALQDPQKSGFLL